MPSDFVANPCHTTLCRWYIFLDHVFNSMQDTHLLLTGGIEKVLRIFDLNHPDAPPRDVDKSPGSIRTVAWLHSDQTILSSCTDMGGVRYVFIDATYFSFVRWCFSPLKKL